MEGHLMWALSLVSWRNARMTLMVALLGWALWGEWRVHALEQLRAKEQLQAARDAAAASENARETERLADRANTRIADELLNAQRARDAAARTAAQRLRELAQARTESASAQAALAACRSYAGPAVHVIPGPTRDALVELARDADAVSDQLRACQSYVRDVVTPASAARD